MQVYSRTNLHKWGKLANLDITYDYIMIYLVQELCKNYNNVL